MKKYNIINIFSIITMLIIVIVLKIIFLFKGMDKYFSNSIIVLIIILTVIMFSIIKEYKKRNLFSPISIANGFLFFIFFVRPLYLMSLNVEKVFDISSVIERYSILYGINEIVNKSFYEALLIGLIGIFSLNAGYYLINNNQTTNNIVLSEKLKGKNSTMWMVIWVCISIIGIVYFFSKYNYSVLINTAGKRSTIGLSFSVYESFWVYTIPCLIIYMYLCNYKKNKKYVICMILVYGILSMAIGRRYIIINVILISIILEYYLVLNRKLNYKIIGMLALAFISVVIYGSIRRNNIGANINESLLGFIVDEFDMFDTLFLSLDYKSRFGLDLYWGVSYISTLFRFIPESLWVNKPTYFDVVHTGFLFKETIKGGTPTSLIGSLYLNFSIIGTIIGSFVTGILFSYIYKFIFEKIKGISIGIYAIFSTFIYDLIRVGDIGREFWTVFIYFFAFIVIWICISKFRIERKYL